MERTIKTIAIVQEPNHTQTLLWRHDALHGFLHLAAKRNLAYQAAKMTVIASFMANYSKKLAFG